MPLTVRLSEPLERALEEYCAEHGLTRSEVVQASLRAHLGSAASKASRATRGQRRAVSRAYQAFQRAGLIGALALDGRSATRDIVRARVVGKLEEKRG